MAVPDARRDPGARAGLVVAVSSQEVEARCSLAVAVGEEPDTLEEVYEPYLIMEGYLKRTSQGRVATELSYKKLGLKPAAAQAGLF